METTLPPFSTDSTWQGQGTKQGSWRRDLVVQAALFLASSLWLFFVTATWPHTPDGWIHLHRVRSLSEALAAGVLFPRWFPDFAFGYGYPVLNFYAPASYYPAALLQLLGADVLVATRLALACFYGVSGVALYRLARLWLSLPASLVAAALFLLFPYRLYDLFVRGALPEFAAFLWLPALAYACALLSARAATAWRSSGGMLAATALCWAGLIVTHNLTALMAALAATVIWLTLLVWAWLAGQLAAFWRATLALLIAFALGVLLSAWYSAPALLEAGWVGIGAGESQGYLNHFAAWPTLFFWAFPFVYPAAPDPTVILPGFLLFVTAAGLTLLFLPGERARRPVTIVCLATLIFALWMTTASSGWLWAGLAPVLSRLQFPWRWQTVAAPAAALLAGLVFDAATRRLALRWALAAALVVSSLAVVYALAGLAWQPATFVAGDITREQMWALDAEYGQVGATWTGEFLPSWVTEQRWAIGRASPAADAPAPLAAITATATLVDASYLGAAYQIEQTQPAPFIFHRFFYPAWQVSVNGDALSTAPTGALGLLTTAALPGAGLVRVDWGATPAVWVGRIAAACGWVIILWLLLQSKRRWLSGLWLAVGALALMTASGVTAQRLPVQQVTGDFGAVQLAGLIAPPARPGGVAWVELHWLATQAGRDLTTFVHLVGPNGEVAAQHDAPLATGYTPASRWLPGEILTARHPLALPAGLAPGQYDLRIGLYAPGAPDQPLTPAGGAAPFASGGVLEVLP